MDGFPSGQRGQTVNLLHIASVVRIHLHPVSRRGGTGRRTGLKILRDLYSRTGSIPVAGMNKQILDCRGFAYFLCKKKYSVSIQKQTKYSKKIRNTVYIFICVLVL